MRVLVADECATLRAGAEQALRAAGHTPVVAASGWDAWRFSREQAPDVAFVGLDLADLDGLELVSLWRQGGRCPWPVVLMTDAAGAEALRLWSALTGEPEAAPDVLRRPVTGPLLADVVGGLLP